MLIVIWNEQAESNLSALTTFRNDFVAAMDEDFNIANGMTVFMTLFLGLIKETVGLRSKNFLTKF